MRSEKEIKDMIEKLKREQKLYERAGEPINDILRIQHTYLALEWVIEK